VNLSDPDRRERLEQLAAEFALGTASFRVRRRLRAVAARDPVVADALARWQRDLAIFADAITPITPAPRVWEGIATQLGLDEGGARTPRPTPWWERLAVWRAFAVASLVIAIGLGVAEFVRPPAPAAAPIVVVLAGADAKPALLATASRDERFLTLKTIANTAPAPGRVFELWALPQGGAPRSLGVIPSGNVVHVPLPSPAAESLTNIPALAVSLEPPGGSPTGQPTGPVLFSGSVERMY
jgi:anti-sigma-K factor RskA